MKTVISGVFALSALSFAVGAAEVDHSKMDHSAMGHGSPAVQHGPWSYRGRDNPKPYKDGRWEMVPVPGYGHMFISTGGLSPELACAALANPGVMTDRATRERCGLTAAPPRTGEKAQHPAGPPPAVDHSKMKH
jgi:hypothetical protein